MGGRKWEKVEKGDEGRREVEGGRRGREKKEGRRWKVGEGEKV